ncbi:VWA domain-containing protein [Puniceicoccaceae bacterium K14]|nr:VWA domain-containing protein [Puniceicoccaceae bacterium K14]
MTHYYSKLLGCLLIFILSAVFPSSFGDEAAAAPYFEVDQSKFSFESFPLKSSKADVRIAGIIAEVTVTQVYQNDGDSTIEATYVFPGSTRAAVHGLEMRLGNRVVKAVIEEKKKARRMYETAKLEGKTTSLLEEHRPNVFQMNLANILPGDEVTVVLSYTEWISSEKGIFEFVYPMVVGPRYSGEASEIGEAWARNPYLGEGDPGDTKHDVSVTLEAGVPVHAIQSPSHTVSADFSGTGGATVSLKDPNELSGNRDFVLRYSLSGTSPASGLIVSKSDSGNYFLAMVQPPVRETITRELNKDYIFVVDVSGSMHGFPLDTTKDLMERLFATLDENDRFNVILFAGTSAFFSEKSLVATSDNKQSALRFIKKEHGGGGTELMSAMKRVYESEVEEGLSRSVVVITDGYISAEAELFQLVERSLNSSNVFSFGIGSSVNRFLIDGLARVGQGEPSVVLHPREARDKALRFSEYVSTPLITNLRVDWEGTEIASIEPLSLPDLLAERPIYVFGKWEGEQSGVLNIRGRSVDGDFISKLDFSEATVLPEGDRSLELIWARNRIQRLSDYSALGQKNDLKGEITNLGLTHGLLTKYTSFVAVDELVRKKVDESIEKVEQALPLPKGVSSRAVSGQSVPVTPEPSTVALMITALLFAGIVAGKRYIKR